MENIKNSSDQKYINNEKEYVDNSTLLTEKEKKQFKALKIMEEVRIEIEKQAFMIDTKLHHDEKFHSALYNGLGTKIEIFVEYSTSGIEVILSLNLKDKTPTQFDRPEHEEITKNEYSSLFKEIHDKISSKFGPTKFILNIGSKEEVIS